MWTKSKTIGNMYSSKIDKFFYKTNYFIQVTIFLNNSSNNIFYFVLVYLLTI